MLPRRGDALRQRLRTGRLPFAIQLHSDKNKHVGVALQVVGQPQLVGHAEVRFRHARQDEDERLRQGLPLLLQEYGHEYRQKCCCLFLFKIFSIDEIAVTDTF